MLPKLYYFLFVVVLLVGQCMLVTSGQNIPFPHLKRPIILSHRGSRNLNPENTLTAFLTSIQLGGHVVEFDIRLTRDEKLVVYHDEKIDRTTNASGVLRSFTLEELQALDAAFHYTTDDQPFPHRGKNVRIPTLRLVLETLWGRAEELLETRNLVNVNIEIKDEDNRASDLLVEELSRYGIDRVKDNVAVVSRFCSVINHFRTTVKHRIPTAACEGEATKFMFRTWYLDRVRPLLSLIPFVDAMLSNAFYKRPEYSVLQIPMYSGGMSLITDQIVKAAHAQQTEVHFWVANSQSEINSVVTGGAEGLITDRTDAAVKILQEHNLYHPAGYDAPTSEPLQYYPPREDWEESHECVTVFCVVIRYLNVIFAILTVAITMTVIKLLRLCFARR